MERKIGQRELLATWKIVAAEVQRRLTSKGLEYAEQEDRMKNFRQASLLRQTTIDDALFGMVTKQIVSWEEFTRRVTEGKEVPLGDWEEKLIDIIVYAFLHLAWRTSFDAQKENLAKVLARALGRKVIDYVAESGKEK